jgi:hypothetical protein
MRLPWCRDCFTEQFCGGRSIPKNFSGDRDNFGSSALAYRFA